MENTPPLKPSIRVQPYTGLVIDVDTWATAHDYHRQHQQLHLLSLHGSGISYGLEVLPTDPPSDSLIVEPGAAIDPVGNVIVVPERQRVTPDTGKGTVYVVLDYVESMAPAVNQQDSRGRLLEDFRLRCLREPPKSPSLELARCQASGSSEVSTVSPANPWSPGPDEIDSRFRFYSRPQAPKGLTVGLVVSGSADALDPEHLRGFHYFLREMGSCGLRPVLAQTPGNDVPEADLLYVTGKGGAAPAAALVKALAAQLKSGTWLFADSCGPGSEFAQGLGTAIKQGGTVAKDTEARLLGAHFIFGAPPSGAYDSPKIIWGGNTIISLRDYGCAWAGRHDGTALPREQIRSALEFGMNAAICASAG